LKDKKNPYIVPLTCVLWPNRRGHNSSRICKDTMFGWHACKVA